MDRAPSDRLRVPSTLLVLSSAVNAFLAVLAFLGLAGGAFYAAMGSRPEDVIPGLSVLFGVWVLYALGSGLTLYGALQMRRVQNWQWSVAGAVAALLTGSGACFFIGIPAAIWALWVLARPDVASAMGQPEELG